MNFIMKCYFVAAVLPLFALNAKSTFRTLRNSHSVDCSVHACLCTVCTVGSSAMTNDIISNGVKV